MNKEPEYVKNNELMVISLHNISTIYINKINTVVLADQQNKKENPEKEPLKYT
jgi:hypothetical protein